MTSKRSFSTPVATIGDVRRVAIAFFGFGWLLGLVVGWGLFS